LSGCTLSFKLSSGGRTAVKTQIIELDCPPGFPRPGDLIEGVIAVSRCFGNWTWDYGDIPEARWLVIQPVIKERITALYHAGKIRYGSW
jgi:hypothetical protein